LIKTIALLGSLQYFIHLPSLLNMQNLTLTNQPQFQDFHIEGVQHISPLHALEAIQSGDAIMLDVREANETAMSRVNLPDVLYHPLSVILGRIKHIPSDKLIIVACPGGVRSSKVVNLLKLQEFPSVVNLDGGLDHWQNMGLPYVKENMSEHSSCCSGGEDDSSGCCSDGESEKSGCCSDETQTNTIKLSSGCGCSSGGGSCC
jgi:rhodanese-related sulfurtransferase